MKKIKNIIWLILLLSGIALLIYSGVMLYNVQKEYKDVNDVNKEVISIFTKNGSEDGTDDPAKDFTVNWDELLSTNPDVIAWIQIPDTKINFPVLQGESNNTYLRKNIYKKYSRGGCIFVDSHNTDNFTDLNTIIYGHNLNNGSMFSNLKKYKDKDYLQKHNYIYIYLPTGEALKYKIFSFSKVKADNYDIYNPYVDDLATYYEIISRYNKFNELAPSDTSLPVITLSTCTNGNKNDRYIIQAYLEQQS